MLPITQAHTRSDVHTHTGSQTHMCVCAHAFIPAHLPRCHTRHVCTLTHTATHVCTHTHMHTQEHLHVLTHCHTCAPTCEHTHTGSSTGAHSHAHIHTQVHTHKHTHSCSHNPTYLCTLTHALTRAHSPGAFTRGRAPPRRVSPTGRHHRHWTIRRTPVLHGQLASRVPSRATEGQVTTDHGVTLHLPRAYWVSSRKASCPLDETPM